MIMEFRSRGGRGDILCGALHAPDRFIGAPEGPRVPQRVPGGPIWAAASRWFGLFGGICDSANSGNSPPLGAAGEDSRGLVDGVSNGPTDRMVPPGNSGIKGFELESEGGNFYVAFQIF